MTTFFDDLGYPVINYSVARVDPLALMGTITEAPTLALYPTAYRTHDGWRPAVRMMAHGAVAGSKSANRIAALAVAIEMRGQVHVA